MKGQDQGIRDAYTAALRPRQNLYCRAVEDFMSLPVVKIIGTSNYTGASGSRISVRALDDFRVTGVQVEIYAANGTLLEKGNAEQQLNGVDWNDITRLSKRPSCPSLIFFIPDIPVLHLHVRKYMRLQSQPAVELAVC
jgi:hypothetical protein